MHNLYTVIASLILYKFKNIFIFNVIDIADICNIVVSTLYRWINFYGIHYVADYDISNIRNINGHVYKRLKSHSKITPECEKYIVTYVLKNNQFKMNKLKKNINRRFLLKISSKSIYSILNKNQITYKKGSLDCKYNTPQRHAYNVKQLKIHIDNVNNQYIAIDEMAVYTNMYRSKGWSKIGNRLTIKRQLKKTPKNTLITAISNEKPIAYKLLKGSANTEIFNKFIIDDVLPKISKGNTLFMDNAKIHKSNILADYIRKSDYHLLFNIPYSPEFNPIELFQNVIKSHIKGNNIDNVSDIRKAIDLHFHKYTKMTLNDFYNHTYKMLLT